MRTLKFRAWDSKKKTFPMVGFDIIGECTVFDLVKQYRLEEHADLTIQQFTGFQDKNGKDVYEGDIVKWEGQFTATIFWCEENTAFQIKSLHGGGGAFLNPRYMLNFEVIGNIFESPELLKSIITEEAEIEDEDEDENMGLETCPQCESDAWDGYICHSCGAKNI